MDKKQIPVTNTSEADTKKVELLQKFIKKAFGFERFMLIGINPDKEDEVMTTGACGLLDMKRFVEAMNETFGKAKEAVKGDVMEDALTKEDVSKDLEGIIGEIDDL